MESSVGVCIVLVVAIRLMTTSAGVFDNIEKARLSRQRKREKDVLTLLRMISGAKYSGVPHSVQVRPFTRFAKPKSVI